MPLLTPKTFLPICLAGIITGYTAAEYVVPRYFHPTVDTQLTTEDIIAAIGAQPYYFRQTTSGNYLAGQFAQRHKDWSKAAEYMNRVLKREGTSADLQKNSMILSMAAGDAPHAIDIAKQVLENDPENILAVLFTSLEEMKNQNYTGAITTFNKIKEASIAAFIIPVLNSWAQAGQNQFSLDTLHPNSFYAYQALLIGRYLNKKDEALTFANKAFKTEENDVRDLEKYADAFVVYGETQKALEIYKAIATNNYASESVKSKIDSLENTKPFTKEIELPDIQNPQDGAALVFQDMAEILLREYSDDSATIFAQMALYLSPKLDKNHAIIGEVFSRNERYDSAIDSFKKIPETSDLYKEAQRLIADLYAQQEQEDKAIQILENLYQKYNDIDAFIQIGDIYRYQEKYEQANETYSNLIKQWDKPVEKYWHVYYARGMALERLKRFKDAEKDLEQALKFRPENPYILNYLGYSWIDQGVELDKAMKMISKAAAYKPNDGYITDSLGWAFYKRGEYKAAVPALERAVALLPYDATINDHLGDAYWKVGRHHEAKFQWERALNYNDGKDIELKEQLEQKITFGLNRKTTSQNTSDTVSQAEKQL